eukprot:COSAG05_NODE_19865_length_286_cov_1.941176_1_plen_64_part_10
MMSGQSTSPVMHDACEDTGQNYLKADIIQSLAQGLVQLYMVVELTHVCCVNMMRKRHVQLSRG